MDKDQDPIIKENSETPELQETLENEEINTVNTETPVEAKTAEVAEKETANEPIEEKKEESKASNTPENLLIDAAPVTKDNHTTIVVVVVIAVIALLGLGFGIFALTQMNKSPKEQINNLMDTASDLLEETTKKQDEIKEKLEKEKKEKEEKEKKEKEEKEKKEKEEKAAKEKAEKEAAAKKEALKTTLDAEGVVSQVSEALVAREFATKEQLVVEDKDNTLYQPAGYKTHIYLAGKNLSGDAISDSNDTHMDDIMPVVDTTLSGLGFEKLETLKDPFMWISSAAIYYNSSTNVTCTSYHFLPEIVSCASATNYSLSEKSLTNSLAEAYNKTEGKYPVVVTANGSSLNEAIEDSGYKQYQTMAVSLGLNAASIFYRESQSSEWKYLLSTQAAIDCSIYSAELQKGLGKHCQTQN